MEWESIIRYTITGLIIGVFMHLVNKGNSKEVEKGLDGEFVLRMNKFYQILGYISVILTIVLIGGVISDYDYDYEMNSTLTTTIILAIFFVFFGGLGTILIMYYQNHILTYNDNKITVQNWRKQTKEITWEEIENIKFSPLSGYLKIYGLGKKLSIAQHMVGLKGFTNMMEAKTKWNARDLRMPF